MSDPVFVTRRASYAYPGSDAPAIDGVDLEIGHGRVTGVIGPNGAGKSTLVRLLSGTVEPTSGVVEFLGRPLASWARTDLARHLAVVGQEPPLAVPQTVEEYVSLGRNPYVSPWSALSAADLEIVSGAIATVGLAPLATRRLTDLSGGERQRAKLARALAQEPQVLILDEPTAHLDIGHALWAFETIAHLVRGGLTAICVTHDINLASRFADELLLLTGGRVGGRGNAGSVLSRETLSRAYDCDVRVEDLGSAGRVVLPVGTRLAAGAGPG